jgi:DNA-binding HxlR family transcriptional regulator
VSTIETLTHHRWALPVLAELGHTGGSRFATLTGKLRVPGESLRRTLAYLQDADVVRRNPGYGHPLRPEYVLTGRGQTLARRSKRLLAALAGYENVGLKKWSLPILAELDAPHRFSELRARLPEATPRALTIALKDLQAAGLVRRAVTDEYPPQVRYEATPAARPIVRAARALA